MKETYSLRSLVLKEIGFIDYAEYLGSDLWRRISLRIYAIKGNRCRGCGEKADCIHHMTYNRGTLLGEDITWLVPICHRCHEMIEFDSGKKRDVWQMQEVACMYFSMTLPPEWDGPLPIPRKKRKRNPIPIIDPSKPKGSCWHCNGPIFRVSKSVYRNRCAKCVEEGIGICKLCGQRSKRANAYCTPCAEKAGVPLKEPPR